MNKVCLLFTLLFSFWTLAEIPRKYLGGGRGLAVYANGDILKPHADSGWSYESKEDKSKEHYFRIDRDISNEKLYTEKENIIIERNNDGSIQRYFEFSKDRAVIKSGYDYYMSSISYKDDFPSSWTVCHDQNECLTIERDFCQELLNINTAIEKGEKSHSDVAKFFTESYKDLVTEQNETMRYAAKNLPIDELHAMNPFSKSFDISGLGTYISQLANQRSFIFSPGNLGGKILNKCQIFMREFPGTGSSKKFSVPKQREAQKNSRSL